ncbi:MAG TPA: glycosyltransferase [Selenomonadales bacterium]|nr:glycosyltransferase [Selenomonadales bacterium]
MLDFQDAIIGNKIIDELKQDDKEQLHIAFGVDSNFACHMGVLMASIVFNNPNLNFIFHVLATSLDDDNVNRLKLFAQKNSTKIVIYDIDDKFFSSWPNARRFTTAAYFRLMLPEIIHDALYVLYLDSDMICMGDISKLIHLDLGNNVLAAVGDTEKVQAKQNLALNLRDHIYFNSGFLYINIENWRLNNISEKVINLLSTNPNNLSLPDQDALNILLSNKVTYLDREWNCLSSRKHSKPIFLHFAGLTKPWIMGYPGENMYLYYKNMSPWVNIPLELPKLYSDMRRYSKMLIKKGEILSGLNWYLKYLWTKTRQK